MTLFSEDAYPNQATVIITFRDHTLYNEEQFLFTHAYKHEQIRIIIFLVSIDSGVTKDNKTISSQTINDAVSMLGALLNVRNVFTRIAADVEVPILIRYN